MPLCSFEKVTLHMSESHTSSSLSTRVSRSEQESKNALKSVETSVCHSMVASSQAGGSGVGKHSIKAWMVMTIC